MPREPIFWNSGYGEIEAALDGARTSLRRYWAGHLALLPFSQEEQLPADGSIDDTPEDRACAEILRKSLACFGLPLVIEDETCNADVVGPCFLIDPLDGTHNALMGYPAFTVSVAMFSNSGEVVFGWVYDLSRDITYLAVRGKGSYIQSPLAVRRLSAKRRSSFQDLAISMMRDRQSQTAVHAIMRHARKVRMSACSSFDLCLIAAGVLDAFVDLTIPGHERTCDIAAASLVLSEAGGILLSPSGAPRTLAPPGSAALVDYSGLIALGDPNCSALLFSLIYKELPNV